MIKIRSGIFETNSSMVHAICICTEEDYKRFVHGELIYDRYNEELVDPPKDEDEGRYWDYDEYGGDMEIGFERYTAPGGEKIVAMYYYGYDY